MFALKAVKGRERGPMKVQSVFESVGGTCFDGFASINAPVHRTDAGTPYLQGAGVVMLERPLMDVARAEVFLRGLRADAEEKRSIAEYVSESSPYVFLIYGVSSATVEQLIGGLVEESYRYYDVPPATRYVEPLGLQSPDGHPGFARAIDSAENESFKEVPFFLIVDRDSLLNLVMQKTSEGYDRDVREAALYIYLCYAMANQGRVKGALEKLNDGSYVVLD